MTPENKNLVNECADLAKRFTALYEGCVGLVSIDSIVERPSVHLPAVHLTSDYFLNCFGDSFEAVDRKDSQFPWKLVHMENGVQFFCITDRNPKA